MDNGFPFAFSNYIFCVDLTGMEMVLGEWIIGGEKKMVKGHIDIPEFSFGELDELQVHSMC